MTDLDRAIEYLNTGDYTCVLCRGTERFTSTARGVKPLVAWYAGPQDLTGFSAADKVVGRATAFLYVLLGVRAVYAGVMSQGAQAVLEAHGVQTAYGSLVDHIINRQGTGICPFEAAVLEISDPAMAYGAIRAKMTALQITLD